MKGTALVDLETVPVPPIRPRVRNPSPYSGHDERGRRERKAARRRRMRKPEQERDQ